MIQEKWHLINETTLMHAGEIFANPFAPQFQVRPSAIWLIENKGTALLHIAGTLNSFVGSTSLRSKAFFEDCYSYALNQFLWGDVQDEDAPIAFLQENQSLSSCTLARLRSITLQYVRLTFTERKSTVALKSKAEISLERGTPSASDSDIAYEDTYSFLHTSLHEVDMLYVDLCTLFHHYFFKIKRFGAFDLERYFTYMYLQVTTDDLSEHLHYVADKVGMPLNLLTWVTAELKKDIQDHARDALDMLEIIRELLKLKTETGWIPPLIRGDAPLKS